MIYCKLTEETPYYCKFTAETPYCGTNIEEYRSFNYKPSTEELFDIAEEICRNNAEGYEYLVTGWDGDEVEGMTEEEIQEALDNYYADCSYSWEEISQEEFLKNT